MILSPYQKPPLGSRIIPGHPFAKGLVLSMLMNEGSGDWVQDYSGNGNHGTCVNMAPQSATSGWGPEPYGSALAFDGSGSYISCVYAGGLPKIGNSPFTMSFWIKASSTSSLAVMFGFGDLGSPPSGGVRYVIQYYGKYYLWVNGSDWDTGITFDIDNIWHNAIFTNDGVNLKFYRDGRLRNSVGMPSFGNTNNNINIGKRYTTWPMFVGKTSSASIYNRALTAQEVAYLYARPYCMFDEPALPAWMYSPGGVLIHPGMNGGLNRPQLRGGLNG